MHARRNLPTSSNKARVSCTRNAYFFSQDRPVAQARPEGIEKTPYCLREAPFFMVSRTGRKHVFLFLSPSMGLVVPSPPGGRPSQPGRPTGQPAPKVSKHGFPCTRDATFRQSSSLVRAKRLLFQPGSASRPSASKSIEKKPYCLREAPFFLVSRIVTKTFFFGGHPSEGPYKT